MPEGSGVPENQETPAKDISKPFLKTSIPQEEESLNSQEVEGDKESRGETFIYHGPKSLKSAIEKAINNSSLQLSRKPNIEVGLFGVNYKELGFKDKATYFSEIDKLVVQMDDLKRADQEAFSRRIDKDEKLLGRLMDEGNSDEYLRILNNAGEEEQEIEEKLSAVEQKFRGIAGADKIKRRSISFETPMEELHKLKNVTLGGYDSFEDKIVLDPASVYDYKSGLFSGDFESTLKHEVTHGELGDCEPYKLARDYFVRAKTLQVDKDQLIGQNPDLMRRLEEFSQTGNSEEVERAYGEFSQDRLTVAKSAGLSQEEIGFLEKISGNFNEQNIIVKKIQKTKNSNGLPALDEGLGWAVGGMEPDFSIYATEDAPESMYATAYSLCKSLLQTMTYEKVVQVVRNAMNRSFKEGKNAVELLREETALLK